MKSIFIAVLAALVTISPIGSIAYAERDSGERNLLRILFPPSENYRKGKYRSDKSPIPRRVVRFSEGHPAGTIIIDTSERRLYHVMGDGKAMRYGVGVGRDGFTWQGKNRISRKAEWPGWTPPEVMRRREAAKGRILPRYMEGGPNNPLGARALYIGSTIYRIHGTNQPWTIGHAMSSGCIRMANDDVRHLYERVDIGTRVIVRH
ncbi:MAG: L,D-transpeptidase [Pseudomonadota bacterium]